MHSPGAILRHWAAVARAILWMYRNHDWSTFRQFLAEHRDARDRASQAMVDYEVLNEQDMLSRKTSRRVYLFGSGYSLNELSDQEWAEFAKHDTIGFSGSVYLKKIPLTYLLLRAWTETSAGSMAWKNDADEIISTIESNPHLDDTVFVFPKGLTAIFSNRLVGYKLWNRHRKIYFYLADKISRQPHRNLCDGLVHGMSTLCSALSLAVALGYDEIVLVGVDLYDSRYFWLPPDKTMGWSDAEQKLVAADHTVRGAEVTSLHNTVHNGVITFLGEWRDGLEQRYGTKLFVYNPRSLLTKTLPIFPSGV